MKRKEKSAPKILKLQVHSEPRPVIKMLKDEVCWKSYPEEIISSREKRQLAESKSCHTYRTRVATGQRFVTNEDLSYPQCNDCVVRQRRNIDDQFPKQTCHHWRSQLAEKETQTDISPWPLADFFSKPLSNQRLSRKWHYLTAKHTKKWFLCLPSCSSPTVFSLTELTLTWWKRPESPTRCRAGSWWETCTWTDGRRCVAASRAAPRRGRRHGSSANTSSVWAAPRYSSTCSKPAPCLLLTRSPEIKPHRYQLLMASVDLVSGIPAKTRDVSPFQRPHMKHSLSLPWSLLSRNFKQSATYAVQSRGGSQVRQEPVLEHPEKRHLVLDAVNSLQEHDNRGLVVRKQSRWHSRRLQFSYKCNQNCDHWRVAG